VRTAPVDVSVTVIAYSTVPERSHEEPTAAVDRAAVHDLENQLDLVLGDEPDAFCVRCRNMAGRSMSQERKLDRNV
jgi:hypothetical protein